MLAKQNARNISPPSMAPALSDGFEKILIFYFPLKEGIELVRVVHGKRDLERLVWKDSSADVVEV